MTRRLTNKAWDLSSPGLDSLMDGRASKSLSLPRRVEAWIPQNGGDINQVMVDGEHVDLSKATRRFSTYARDFSFPVGSHEITIVATCSPVLYAHPRWRHELFVNGLSADTGKRLSAWKERRKDSNWNWAIFSSGLIGTLTGFFAALPFIPDPNTTKVGYGIMVDGIVAFFALWAGGIFVGPKIVHASNRWDTKKPRLLTYALIALLLLCAMFAILLLWAWFKVGQASG